MFPTNTRRGHLVVVVLCLLASQACIPFTLGSSAQTIPKGDARVTESVGMTSSLGLLSDSVGIDQPIPSFDTEARVGLSDHADAGVRVVNFTGVVLTYRRRVGGAAHPDSAAISWQLGGGLVNLGAHGIIEAGLLVSSAARGPVAWYGGARVVQVFPMESGILNGPSMGLTVGVRLGSHRNAVLPEVSVYRTMSAVTPGQGNIVVMPAISFASPWLDWVLKLFGLADDPD